MSEELTGIGSAEAGNPDGGNGGESKGSVSPAAATPPGQQPADNLDWAKAKGWLNDDGTLKAREVGEGYRQIEKQMGAINRVPDEKAKPEEWEAFHKRMGWPGEAKGYEFKRPDGLPENLPYDERMAERFKEWANEAKLPKGTAQSLHDMYVRQFADDLAALEKETADKAKAAHDTLVKEWGDVKSEDYIRNRDAAARALRADPKLKGLEDELKMSGLLTKDGVFTSPALANLLAGYGQRMQNDSFTGAGEGQGGAANPFDPKSPNLTEQMLLKRNDPTKARALAQAAGWSAEKLQSVFG